MEVRRGGGFEEGVLGKRAGGPAGGPFKGARGGRVGRAGGPFKGARGGGAQEGRERMEL